MITILSGENDIQRQAEVQRLTGIFLRDHDEMGLERLDGEEASYDRMHEAIQSVPFLSDKKLIILRRPSANKEFLEKFETFIADIADMNDLLIVELKLDKRLAYYKTLKKMPNFRDFNVLDSNGLARYLMTYAGEQGATITSNAARYLIERVGLNQLTLQHEIDKLATYDQIIDRTTIDLLTEKTPQSSIFELLDAVFAGKAQVAATLYREQRALKVEPQQIIAMLVWQLYILALVKTAGDRTIDQIAAESKVSPFTVRKSQVLARNISLPQLKALTAQLRGFDVRLKSEGIIADEVVQYYLLNMAN